MMCEWDTARYLIFSDNGIPLIYYSHFTSIAIFVGLFLITFLRIKSWPRSAFRLLSVSYIIWLACDLVLWGNEQINHVMFFWTLINLVEPLIFIAAYSHLVSFTEKRNLTWHEYLAIFVLLVPTLIMAPTGLSTVGFDYTTCDRNVAEGVAAYYNYFLEAVFLVLVLAHGIKRFIKLKREKQRVDRLVLATMSSVLLMGSFLFANFLGTFLVDYDISQLGHIAVPLFAAILAFITIKFETFEPRVLIIDVFTIALLILVFSLLFIQNEGARTFVTFLTLILSLPLAYALLSGIRREVNARQQIQKLAEELQVANNGQADLLHIINHQIKGYMTKARYVFDALMNDKDYAVSDSAQVIVKEGYTSVTEGVNFVQDFLNASNIERGTFTYTMAPMDISEVVATVAEGQKENAIEKGLTFNLNIVPGNYSINGDKAQLSQAIRNLMDNSIKYTPNGGLTVALERKPESVLFTVKDTGVGLSDEVKPKLFTKGGRDKDSIKINVNSTGFGLAFVKGVAEAHKGRVWAESPGVGKGSSFYMELPTA
jgi:signal transduction histidine kinase